MSIELNPNPESNPEPKPSIQLDFTTATAKQFAASREAFLAWVAQQPPFGPLDFPNGWYTVEPAKSWDFLRRNVSNRESTFGRVKQYWWSMDHDDWHKTGQALIFDESGKLIDGGHRCWASLLGNVSFDTYIITNAPVEPDLFAYMDDVKARTAADALRTSGADGVATHVAGAVILAHRYELGALGAFKLPKTRKLNTREILDYSRVHASLSDVGHSILPNYSAAVSVIGNKAVVIFFADLVQKHYGDEVLDPFLIALGNGANLDIQDPILGLRNRLLRDGYKKDHIKEHALALLLKAFNFHIEQKKLGKNGLFIRDNEEFPRLILPTEIGQQSASE